MADLFANWAALAAVEVENVDYRLPIRPNRSLTACIAIHGGSIEPGSSEAASGVAAWCRHNYYSLEGIKSSGNSDLHITSTNYDEPKGLALVHAMDYCFSFHGMADQTVGVAETYVGGLDTVYRDAVISALQGAGFTASVGTAELNGSSAQNITNETRRSMGVQLEMSLQQRKNFFTSGDTSRANRETGVRTQAYFDYVKAIASVANDLGGGASQTSQYRLNLAQRDDQMSDFETWLNFNWEKLKDAASPPSGTTLPQSGPYNVGDRFYKTDTKSIYLLVTKDVNWGWYWRPIQDAISPWFTVPSTCLALTGWSLNSVPAAPFQIALDNRGRCYWRGVLSSTPGTFARLNSFALFNFLPTGLRPSFRGVWMLGHETLAVGTTAGNLNTYQGARMFIPREEDVNPSVRSFGGTADFNKVHLTGISYSVGTSRFTSP
jgi:phage replication-related protein YjqB (UPF0714/DUF867 family)